MDLHPQCRALASCGAAASRGIGDEEVFRLKFELLQKLRQVVFDVFFTQIYRGKTRRFSSLHFQFLFEPKETCIVQFDKLSAVDCGPSTILLHFLAMLHHQIYILK